MDEPRKEGCSAKSFKERSSAKQQRGFQHQKENQNRVRNQDLWKWGNPQPGNHLRKSKPRSTKTEEIGLEALTSPGKKRQDPKGGGKEPRVFQIMG